MYDFVPRSFCLMWNILIYCNSLHNHLLSFTITAHTELLKTTQSLQMTWRKKCYDSCFLFHPVPTPLGIFQKPFLDGATFSSFRQHTEGTMLCFFPIFSSLVSLGFLSASVHTDLHPPCFWLHNILSEYSTNIRFPLSHLGFPIFCGYKLHYKEPPPACWFFHITDISLS